MLKKKTLPKPDKYGYYLKEITWGNYGTSLYNQSWGFFIVYENKENKTAFAINIGNYLPTIESKKPRKTSKEIKLLLETLDVVSAMKTIIDKYPQRPDKIIKEMPTELFKDDIEKLLLKNLPKECVEIAKEEIAKKLAELASITAEDTIGL